MKSGYVQKVLTGCFLALLGLTFPAFAAGGNADQDGYKMTSVHWHFSGPFGVYDKAAVQRGYQVYREVCAACHALDHLSFHHLGEKGGPYYNPDYVSPNDNPDVKALAADWLVSDIDGETGDNIDRPGIPSDAFPVIFANEEQARASNGGALPPDLSIIVSARNDGVNYLYNLLMAYGTHMPEEMQDKMPLQAGSYYNPVFDGHVIAMAPPLSDELVSYQDGTPATRDQMARDVSEFLAWTADPKMELRKQMGLSVMIYLLILSLLLWLSYRRVWRRVEH